MDVRSVAVTAGSTGLARRHRANADTARTATPAREGRPTKDQGGRMSRRMVKLIAGRMLVALATLLFVSAVVFGATQLLPGDVAQAILGQSATPEAVAGLRHALGLDVPALQRFVSWLGGLVTGDAGVSLVSRQPVGDLIWTRLSSSLILAGIVAAISVPLALTLGITAAVWRGSLYDRAV
ncbi:MAG: ABC transporter permease, partial [Parafilimonas terrae]|nr:ABC transporter permease [Parafilimonas terrae]